MRKQRIVRRALSFPYREGPGRWSLRDAEQVPLARAVIGALAGLPARSTREAEVYKHSAKKVVFRPDVPPGSAPCVAKVFYVGSLRRRLKHRLGSFRFAEDEAANLLVARERGLSVPALLGFGRVRTAAGFEVATIVLLEYLDGRISVADELATSADEARRAETLLRTVPVFVALFRAACNHSDVNGGNILLARDRADRSAYLVDLQNAFFFDRPNAEILMAETGRLARTCEAWIAPEARARWLDAILDGIGIERAARSRWIERFEHYRVSDPPKEERIRVGRSGAGTRARDAVRRAVAAVRARGEP